MQRGRLHNPDAIATSVGLGLRVKTPLGPMKLDLGCDSTKLEELDSHFTIGDF